MTTFFLKKDICLFRKPFKNSGVSNRYLAENFSRCNIEIFALDTPCASDGFNYGLTFLYILQAMRAAHHLLSHFFFLNIHKKLLHFVAEIIIHQTSLLSIKVVRGRKKRKGNDMKEKRVKHSKRERETLCLENICFRW